MVRLSAGGAEAGDRANSLPESGERAPGASAIFTVSQVTSFLKEALESDPALADLWVSGEVSNHHLAGSGHSYFSLRDEGGVVRCVMFRSGRGHEFLSDGAQVLVHGRVSFYAARGDLQLYADLVRPEGLGALQRAFEKLKRRLEADGLFDPSRKRLLPGLPKRIALVTSPDGAVLHDILNVLGRRYPLVEVGVAPTPVQGEGAVPGIVGALRAVDADGGFDIAIVARGGGSLEDLWPFNDEQVARAIFASRTPIVSAIGHETDVTIADLVADVRAPTPSAAAELVTPDRLELIAEVESLAGRSAAITERALRDRRVNLELSADHLGSLSPDTLGPREDVDELLRVARLALGRQMERFRGRIGALEAALSALGPEKILARGYAIVKKGRSGPVVIDSDQVEAGDRLDITLRAGAIEAETLGVRPSRDGRAAL